MEMYLDFIHGLPIVVQDPMAQKDRTHTDQKGVSDRTPRPSIPSPPEGGSAEPQEERSRLAPDGADSCDGHEAKTLTTTNKGRKPGGSSATRRSPPRGPFPPW
jgi:hypothetical protein